MIYTWIFWAGMAIIGFAVVAFGLSTENAQQFSYGFIPTSIIGALLLALLPEGDDDDCR